MKHSLKKLFTLFILSISIHTFAISLNSFTRAGAYQTNGSYCWTYTGKVTSAAQKAENYTVKLSTPTDFPFEVIELPATLSADTLTLATLVIKISVPADYITEPANLKPYKLKITLKGDNEKSLSFTFFTSCPLPEHPRLFIRKNELAELKRHFTHPDFNDIRKYFNEQKNYTTDGIVSSNQPDERIRQKMEALSLEYLMDTVHNKNSGREAIKLAINYMNSYSTNRVVKAVSYEENTNTYEAILGGSIVYDWCYGLLTDKEKTELFSGLKKVCMLGEYGLPGTGKVQYLAGHYGECAPTAYMAIGIATYDEDPSFFDFEYDEQVNKFAPSRNPMYKAGTHHQGAQYIHVRFTHELLQHFMLNKLGLSPYDKDIYKAVYRAIYGTIPQKKDMDGMPEGDGHKHLEMGYSQLYYLAANLSKDPVLQTVSKDNLMATKHQSARLFVYHNPDIQPKPMDSLCLSRFFPSPSGIMIARTKWDMDATDFSSNVMLVLMNMKEYNAQNHTHMDGGHFDMYYKGHMALDAGIYQGKDAQNGWAKLNYTNYFARTVAHNSLLIYDPNEPLPGGWDKKQKVMARDGGQFFFGDHAWDTSADMFKAGKSATILAEEISAGLQPDYSYFKGDLTNSYNVPKFIGVYPPKAELLHRSFVFLNHKSNDIPGTLIVLDKIISTNAAFKKTWLLHTQNEPEINGNKITAVNINDGRDGKLINNVLLPELSNANIQKIGGPGKEYWCDSQNWGSITQEDAGCWRIELSPRANALADNFLNVLQAMDAGYSPSKQIITSTYSDNKEYAVITVKDRIVAEQLALGVNEQSVSFNAGNVKTTYKVLITDLKTGNWKITSPNGIKHLSVSDASGTLYFQSEGGKFMVEKE
ncbi:MAG: hypothetical protein WCK78_18450 [Paludibacter sp.]